VPFTLKGWFSQATGVQVVVAAAATSGAEEAAQQAAIWAMRRKRLRCVGSG
jgi:hypothetical protein